MGASESSEYRPENGRAPRRNRFQRDPAAAPKAVTPLQIELLDDVNRAGILDLFGLAALAGRSAQQTRRIIRPLFDGGYVSVIPVTRAAMADATGSADPSLLLGSAANAYAITRLGRRLLHRNRGVDGEAPRQPTYDVRQSPFVAHEIEVGRMYVWLRLVERSMDGCELMRWHRGAEAVIDLGRNEPPRTVRPDAWFVLRIGANHLAAFVEADRSTEGRLRWGQKLAAYRHLFAAGTARQVTGMQRSRIVVTTLTPFRRDALAKLIAAEAEPALAKLFWVAERGALNMAELATPVWRRAGHDGLRPLVELGG